MENAPDISQSAGPTIDKLNTEKYEAFFQKNVLRDENGKYAIYNEKERTFVLLKWDNGSIVPFYRSSSGTSVKRKWGWFAYFGRLSDRYISKAGSVYELDNGYGSSKIRAMQEEINKALDYDHTYDTNETLQDIMPFLGNQDIKTPHNPRCPTHIPQAKDINDQDGIVQYQNAWINLIEGTEGVQYTHTLQELRKVCANTSDVYIIELAESYWLAKTLCQYNPNLTDTQQRNLLFSEQRNFLWDLSLSKGGINIDCADSLLRNTTLTLWEDIQRMIFSALFESLKEGSRIWSYSLCILVKRHDFALQEYITPEGVKIIDAYNTRRTEYITYQDEHEEEIEYNEAQEEEEKRIMRFPIEDLMSAMASLQD